MDQLECWSHPMRPGIHEVINISAHRFPAENRNLKCWIDHSQSDCWPPKIPEKIVNKIMSTTYFVSWRYPTLFTSNWVSWGSNHLTACRITSLCSMNLPERCVGIVGRLWCWNYEIFPDVEKRIWSHPK